MGPHNAKAPIGRRGAAFGRAAALLVVLGLVAGCSSTGTGRAASTTAPPTAAYPQPLPVVTGPLTPVDPPALTSDAARACRTGPVSQADADEACTGATMAYVWGYALVAVMRTRARLACLTPVNQLVSARTLATPSSRAVVAPNNDTLYSTTFLDLRDHPMELDFPPVTGRYANFQLMDAYSNTFADIGTLTTGAAGGRYAIVAPTWKGTLPHGLVRIVAPTPDVWLLGRTAVDGPADLPNVVALQARYRLVPVAATGASHPRPPAMPSRCAPSPAPIGSSGIGLFDEISADMAADPPLAADATTVAAMAAVGIGPGRHPTETTDPQVRAGYQRALRLGPAIMRDDVTTRSTTSTGWNYGTVVGTYGTDYVTRASIAESGLAANLPTQARYYNASATGGHPLTGQRAYVVHFGPGQLPPVSRLGFWSLTMYDPDHFLVPNPIDRYSIGDRTPGLVHQPDGSLDLYLSATAPAGHRSNWLPAPVGPFVVSLRLYAPTNSSSDGSWLPPPIRPATT